MVMLQCGHGPHGLKVDWDWRPSAMLSGALLATVAKTASIGELLILKIKMTSYLSIFRALADVEHELGQT